MWHPLHITVYSSGALKTIPGVSLSNITTSELHKSAVNDASSLDPMIVCIIHIIQPYNTGSEK